MRFTISQVLNATALVLCLALLGVAIADISLAADGGATLRHHWPAGEYSWWALDMEDLSKYVPATLKYDRSSETKTFVSAAFSLIVAVLGTVGFWFKNKTAVGVRVPVILLASAAIALIVSTVSVIWSAVSEELIINTTCAHFNGVRAGQTLTCSSENAACNAIGFTNGGDWGQWGSAREKSCEKLRYSRYMVAALSGISFVLVVLYAALIWVSKPNERDHETAQRKALATSRGEE